MNKYKTKDLSNRILLQEKSNMDNIVTKYVWNDVKFVWAKIEYISIKSNEKFDAMQIKGIYNFIIRSLNHIDETMRIIFIDKIYNIKHINKIDKNFINIICEEE